MNGSFILISLMILAIPAFGGVVSTSLPIMPALPINKNTPSPLMTVNAPQQQITPGQMQPVVAPVQTPMVTQPIVPAPGAPVAMSVTTAPVVNQPVITPVAVQNTSVVSAPVVTQPVITPAVQPAVLPIVAQVNQPIAQSNTMASSFQQQPGITSPFIANLNSNQINLNAPVVTIKVGQSFIFNPPIMGQFNFIPQSTDLNTKQKAENTATTAIASEPVAGTSGIQVKGLRESTSNELPYPIIVIDIHTKQATTIARVRVSNSN